MTRAVVVLLAFVLAVGPAPLAAANGWSNCCCPPPCNPCVVVDPCAPATVESAKPSTAGASKPVPAESIEPLHEGASQQPAGGMEQPAIEAPQDEPSPAIESTLEPASTPAPTEPAPTEPATPVGSFFQDAPSATPAGEATSEPAAPPRYTTPAAEPATAEPGLITPAPDSTLPPAEVTPEETTTPAEPATTPAPATPTTPEEETDIFDIGRRVLSEPGGLFSDSNRTWSDSAGRYSCVARLTVISPSGVVLHRADGGEARVAFSALSDADLHFVQRQIRARQMQLGATNATFATAATP